FSWLSRSASISCCGRRGAVWKRSMAEHVPVVSLQAVSKVFHASGQQTTALQSIDLEIQQGVFVSVIGPSGCGKSTLLRIIGDCDPPTPVNVRVNGKSARGARLKLAYGIVFEESVLFEWPTVQANVALPLEVTKIARPERARRVAQMLALVELDGFGQ